MSTTADKTRFVRVLGRRDILALAFGAMIGWSWVVLTGAWIGSAGTVGAIAAFTIGGVAILLISLILPNWRRHCPLLVVSMSILSERWVLELPLFAPGASSSVMHLW